MTRHLVCAVEDLTVDHAIRIVLEGIPMAVVRGAENIVYAIGDTCTHGEMSLAEGFVEGVTLECWAHGSRFSLITGEPLNLPAYEPVPVFDVFIEDGQIYIDPSRTRKRSQNVHS